jgi:hypothetical protein
MKRNTKVVLLISLVFVLSLFWTANKANGHTINLNGTIRDFQSSHPDFEKFSCGHMTGLIQQTLGDDKKPLFGENGYDCINSN